MLNFVAKEKKKKMKEKTKKQCGFTVIALIIKYKTMPFLVVYFNFVNKFFHIVLLDGSSKMSEDGFKRLIVENDSLTEAIFSSTKLCLLCALYFKLKWGILYNRHGWFFTTNRRREKKMNSNLPCTFANYPRHSWEVPPDQQGSWYFVAVHQISANLCEKREREKRKKKR